MWGFPEGDLMGLRGRLHLGLVGFRTAVIELVTGVITHDRCSCGFSLEARGFLEGSRWGGTWVGPDRTPEISPYRRGFSTVVGA
jgi:hypothetical protein